ncbi:MAG: SUMF1/EgtB/PvdO family nonheme iron enzyme [Opitutaceae bacterium]
MRIPFFSRSDWQDPDWRVREQAAFQLRDQSKLLFLAIQDVSEEVRVAASKSLREDKYRSEVVRNGYCEHARRLALAAIRDQAALRAILNDHAVPAALRLAATKEVQLSQPEYLAVATNESNPELRAWAVDHLQKSEAANALFSFDLPDALRLSLIPKLTDKQLLAQIATTESEVAIQALALAEISDEPQLAALFAKLEDTGLRRKIIDRVRTPVLLEEMLADADEEPLRVHLVEQLEDQEMLGRIAREDHFPMVRIVAIRKLRDASISVLVVNHDPDRRVRLAALETVGDEEAFAFVAQNSDDEQLRWRAVERIQSELTLQRLENAAPHADVRWQVGRKLGRAPLEDFFAITNAWTLRRIAEAESVLVLQQMAVRLVSERHVLDELAFSRIPSIAAAARQVLQVTTGPVGISFVPVPERPYELSLFAITQDQARALLGEDPRWATSGDLPATGLTPVEVTKICALMQKDDGAVYRLPSFEEWLHATLAGDKRWCTLPAGTSIESWVAYRLNLNAGGPRTLRRAWLNPWGLLDTIGNVSFWVDEDPGPTSWINHSHERDGLSAGSRSEDIRSEDYAVAAGPHWADVQLKQTRWERLVRLANITEYARDKVGLRLVRASRKTASRATEYRLVLESEPRWGLSHEKVIAALSRSTVYTYGELEKFYRVAPIAVLVSPDYEFIRKLQSVFRRCGADVGIVSRAAETR